MARIFVSRALPGEGLDRLRAAGHQADVWPDPMPPSPAQLAQRTAGAQGLLCLLVDRIDEDFLAAPAAADLKVIANYAVGSDNIDLAAAARRGIQVGTTPDVLTDATADLAFALLLAAARNLPAAHRAVLDGGWHTWEPQGWLGRDVHGATLLIFGPGRIGQAVARRARGFDMRVLTIGRDDDLHQALPEADFVSLHAPLTEATRHVIDAAALAAMKATAILVNTARGGLVDQQALAQALHARRLAAAALDVTDPEPLPAGHPLWSSPGALITPHVGGASTAFMPRAVRLLREQLGAYAAGRPLRNLV
jgi:glyoxylate reductase